MIVPNSTNVIPLMLACTTSDKYSLNARRMAGTHTIVVGLTQQNAAYDMAHSTPGYVVDVSL
jgi:hypothetical protein